MSDKSPRQTISKKSGKSLKEKRAAKRVKLATKLSAPRSYSITRSPENQSCWRYLTRNARGPAY
jgi:hypothetical protein